MDHRGGLTALEPADTYELAQQAADRALARRTVYDSRSTTFR
ncbi:MAG TPA: hypothetical protein VGE86_01105 [Thermoanaerobaculia bacterium]